MTVTFVGDLSINDARLLAEIASRASRILEFGVGGSTQIFAQAAPPGTPIFSVDTDDGWIERTKENLAKLSVRERVTFLTYQAMWSEIADEKFDLIFDDGRDDLRLEFARQTWDRLSVGGMLVFHDTRRARDAANVFAIASERFLEIDMIRVNVSGSNLTSILKKDAEPYVNWNYVEGREPWMWGAGLPPDGWPSK